MHAVQVKEGAYLGGYGSLDRFINYFYQIDGVRRLKSERVLYIGVGDGLVPNYLSQMGHQVTTFDFDTSVKPDVVGDIRALPFEPGSFDNICIFQVLEHIPWEDTQETLKHMARITTKHVYISVPHRRTGFEVVLKFPFMRSLIGKMFLRLALLVPLRFRGFESSGQHYWEIDGRSTTLRAFRSRLREHFDIVEEFTPPLDHFRRFFVLQKRS